MRVSIVGYNLPGAEFCRPDGSAMEDVRVGIQIGSEPVELYKADVNEAIWNVDIDAVEKEGKLDFRGPAVHGKRGERFLYLTWGNVGPDGSLERFRRAKVMLNRVDETLLQAAVTAGCLVARVNMTNDKGHPIAARIDPPAVNWSIDRT